MCFVIGLITETLDEPFLSRRESRPKSWLILLTTITLMFSMSTYCLAYRYFNFYYQVYSINFSSDPVWRNRPLIVRERIAPHDFAYFIIFMFEVSSASEQIVGNFGGAYYRKYLTGDAVVIWRTWVVWKGAWPCYGPIILWIASFGSYLSLA
jgi:hypothetical protein